MRKFWILAVAVLVVGCDGTNATSESGRQAPDANRQVLAADSSCAGGCAAKVLAYTGSMPSGVHFVDLGSVQNGVRVFLHNNVLTGGGDVQMVTSTNCSAWVTFDPVTELAGTSATLSASFTAMGFDAPEARCVGIRNTAQMDTNLLLWAIGI